MIDYEGKTVVLASEVDKWMQQARADALREAASVIDDAIHDRINDLRSCNKNDDCYSLADGAELALDDALIAIGNLLGEQ